MLPSAQDLNARGIELRQEGDEAGARFHFLAALEVDPDFLPPLANLATLAGDSLDLRTKEVAIVALKRILRQAPDNGSMWNNLGTLLMQSQRYDAAMLAMTQAKIHTPDVPATWHNLGLLHHRLGKFDDALECLAQVEALGAGGLGVTNDRAHVLLAKGDLDFGLEAFEVRWEKLIHSEAWDFHIPEWQGESLLGKRILFHGEQGFGDDIMCARFARKLVELRGAKVSMALQPSMTRLFSLQGWPGVEILDLHNLPADCADRFDYHTPMMSAMRWLGITGSADIDSAPYIRAPSFPNPLVDSRRFNVGICWSSGKRGTIADWRRRVTPLELWMTLAELPEVQLWSLNKDAREDIEEIGAEPLVRDPTHEFKDWTYTAAFMKQLDMVVSVDTSIVHLAGAMGVPCIMVSQFSPCWRWWNIAQNSGKPWYRDLRIYRQLDPHDWKSPLNAAKIHLEEEVVARSRKFAA